MVDTNLNSEVEKVPESHSLEDRAHLKKNVANLHIAASGRCPAIP
jgi:hypothetical protein